MIEKKTHYDWLDEHFVPFLASVFASTLTTIKVTGDADSYRGLIAAHGDKVYQYKKMWSAAGIKLSHGAAIYLLSHVHPYSTTVRTTKNGWVAPSVWVLREYERWKHLLPACGPDYP